MQSEQKKASYKNYHDNKSYPPNFQAGSTARESDSFHRNPAGHVIIKQAIDEKKGTILIVDISGYSQFVKQADNTAGANVISSLLGSLIKNNTLGFKISEIEGDAILFYKYGSAPPVTVMLSQFEQMLTAFNERIKQLKINCPQAAMLSIKMVAHYGAIAEFKVERFRKIYGQAVVEAHRLLKNHIHSHTYALVTHQYFQQDVHSNIEQWEGKSKLCEIYDVGELCYTYFPYTMTATSGAGRSFPELHLSHLNGIDGYVP